MRRLVPMVALLLAGILVGGVGGVMVGASTTASVKACVTKTTNVMRYTTSTCKSGEKVLTWNVAGVAGPKGATGATGPQGAQGVPGPQGPAGSGSGNGATSFYEVDGGPGGFDGVATLAAIRLPAGTYLLDYAVTGRTGKGTIDACILTQNPTALQPTEIPFYITLASTATISLFCHDTGLVNYQQAVIVATLANRLSL